MVLEVFLVVLEVVLVVLEVVLVVLEVVLVILGVLLVVLEVDKELLKRAPYKELLCKAHEEKLLARSPFSY